MQLIKIIFLCIVATTLSSELRAQAYHTGYYRNQFVKKADSIFYVQNNRLFFGFKDSIGSGASLDTTSLSNRINARLPIADTSAMLSPYFRKSDTTSLSSRINSKISANSSISGATKTKITYDASGLVTAGSDASTADIAASTNKNYVTDAQLVILGNTSGTNTGDQVNITGNASTVTTNANLLGPITSVGNTTSVASQTGTGSTFVMDNTPTLITPNIGVATATTLNTGTTLNGVVFAKSTTDISLSSTAHAFTAGGESNSTNLAVGEYSTGTGLQSRNNGAIGALHFNPYSGDVRIGSAYAGAQHFTIFNTDAGTGSYIEMGLRNSAGSADALLFRTLGTGFTTSGMNTQDGAMIGTSTSLLGGLSIGTQASADLRLYTNNTLRWTMAGATGNVSTTGQFTSSGGGIGYETGAGGTVTQLTSRTTAVTLNKLCGNITMFSAAQAINAMVTFTLTNSYIAAGDYLLVQHISATNGGAWGISTVTGAGSATISIRNNTTASITEATPLKFFILKATTN